MATEKAESTRAKLIEAATGLFRKVGFLAATVDDVCSAAGVSKGAFFHHFDSKESLAEACLAHWCQMIHKMESSASFASAADPLDRLLGAMDFYIGVFESPDMIKSCLAGTTVQEISETHPRLREAANACFVSGQTRFKSLIDAATAANERSVDSESLAALWLATMQGALLVYKASRDATVIRRTLSQIRELIRSQVTKAGA
ncbi:MAG: TetR/AcrR family transcriptional regulator [Planctomycetes bacterium]|nr:TetR/AcrR family transcriptional regulator [Planctomycetota bacterium]